MYQSSPFVIYPNCTKLINCTSMALSWRKFSKKYQFILGLKNTQTETIWIARKDMKMFTENFKNILFWVVSVAHDRSCDCLFFYQKHKSLKNRAIEVYYRKNFGIDTQHGTQLGTRVTNSEKCVPNKNYISLNYNILPNSIFSCWTI